MRGTLLFLSRCIGALDVLGLSHNIAVVEPGRVYRSGTLPTRRLKRILKRHGIKTVLNLRGGTGEPWHDKQRALLDETGVTLHEIRLSPKAMPSPAKMDALAKLLSEAETPILIHCRSGADRTGLAAAVYVLAVRNKPISEARRQLSFRYGHFPWLGSQTRAMGNALDRFNETYKQKEK